MQHTVDDILSVLDRCCEKFTFPMLDNGYVYLAATRLALYRSAQDWAMVIEVFGFSPRAGLPDTHIHTFGSRLVRQKTARSFVSRQAYETYLAQNPDNESVFVHPVDEGDWQDPDNGEILAPGQHAVQVRGERLKTPPAAEYARHGITLEDEPRVGVFEYCRYLAAQARDKVLATEQEQGTCVPSGLSRIMQLDQWHHPDLLGGELPSTNATFRSLAEVLVSGDTGRYQPAEEPNTHWSNWPDGGTL